LGDQPQPGPLNFKEIAAVIRPDGQRRATDAVDQTRRIRRHNYVTDATLARGNLNTRFARQNLLHSCFRHAVTVSGGASISAVAGRLCATRFAARSNESNVPASVHQPSRIENVSVPS